MFLKCSEEKKKFRTVTSLSEPYGSATGCPPKKNGILEKRSKPVKNQPNLTKIYQHTFK